MTEQVGDAPLDQPSGLSPAERKEYVVRRYERMIRYYWRAASFNKRAYKWTRYWLIVLGAFVTLVTALSSADWVKADARLARAFEIGAPLIAATLTILGGLSQTFQWGATWRDAVLTAERLEKELDRISVTNESNLDSAKDLAALNDLVVEESRGFFDRVLGKSQVNHDPRSGPDHAAGRGGGGNGG